jgi:GldM C-terminal domain
MKKIIQVFLLLSTSSMTIGQTTVLINETGDRADSRTVYIGIDNRFKVKEPQLIQKVKGAAVKLNKDELIIRPTSIGQLPVSFVNKNGSTETINFRVERIPDPVFTVGENPVNVVGRKDLSAESILSINSSSSGSSFFADFDITYFEAKLNGEIFRVNGNKFPEELVKAIQRSKQGEKLALSVLKARSKRSGMHFNTGSEMILDIN